MTGDVVYNTLLDAIRKDKRGLSLNIDEFNRLSVVVNRRLLSDYCKKFEEGVDITSSIGSFKMLDQLVTLSGGKATLPSDYYQLIGDPYYTDSGSVVRGIDLTTSLEHSKRERDYLTKSTLKHPTCVIGSEDSNGDIEIRVYPTSISSIYIDYIRETATPFLDYYINDTTLETTFLTEGQQGVVVAAGSTYRTGATGTFNSLTQDWDFDEDDLPMIIAYFMQSIGVTLPDQFLVEAAITDKQQIEG